MEFETTETVRSTPSRHEKSLGLLTMKFVSLLQEAKDGVLDLKVVSKTAMAAPVFFCLRVVFFFVEEWVRSRCLCTATFRGEQKDVSPKQGPSGVLICLNRWAC